MKTYTSQTSVGCYKQDERALKVLAVRNKGDELSLDQHRASGWLAGICVLQCTHILFVGFGKPYV